MNVHEINMRLAFLSSAIDSDSVSEQEKHAMRLEVLKLIEERTEKVQEMKARGYGLS